MPKKAKTKPVIGCWGFALIVFLILVIISYLDPAESRELNPAPRIGSESTFDDRPEDVKAKF